MLPEKWQQLVGNIQDNFQVLEHDKQHLDDQGGVDIEYIVFNGPLGKMKLEFITKSVVLDRKTKYSNRFGAETVVEYIYSQDEKSHKLKAYKWDEAADDWLEMEAKKFDL
ncbi:MAG: hypothetical protein PHS62_03090 [Patescibacteria group bacterium]|nr:hypothetical protein [Patescibacteria group bacterium]